LPSATPDCSELLPKEGIEGERNERSNSEHSVILQSPVSSSVLPVSAPVDLNRKKNKQVRRSSSRTNRVNATLESQTTVTSVASLATIDAEVSVPEDALATSNAKSQAVVADDVFEDTDCSSSVMHREYFSHVRRVNLENLSLVIGSNLPVFQVIFYPSTANVLL
jgi:hypothetical protein